MSQHYQLKHFETWKHRIIFYKRILKWFKQKKKNRCREEVNPKKRVLVIWREKSGFSRPLAERISCDTSGYGRDKWGWEFGVLLNKIKFRMKAMVNELLEGPKNCHDKNGNKSFFIFFRKSDLEGKSAITDPIACSLAVENNLRSCMAQFLSLYGAVTNEHHFVRQ